MEVECGWLEIIIGPMFSGKSSELLRRLELYEYSGHPTLLIKSALDYRHSKTKVVTHSGLKRTALIIEPTYESFMNLEKELKKVKIFGLDEFQFFEDSDALVSEIVRLSNEKRVFISALNYDFRGEHGPL